MIRPVFIACAAMIPYVSGLTPDTAFAQIPIAGAVTQGEEATLEEILVAGLKVRTAGEKAFIARVVSHVEQGQLSEALVKAVFQRARSQHSRYPYPYFVAMIREVARQRGVIL